MSEEQKLRLEKELRMLKESYEAEIISREEYEKGKHRIERKLEELESRQAPQEDIVVRELKEATLPVETSQPIPPENIQPEKEQEKTETKEESAENLQEEPPVEESAPEEAPSSQESIGEEVKQEKPDEEEKPLEKEAPKKEKKKEPLHAEKEKKSKKIFQISPKKWAVPLIILLMIIAYFYFNPLNSEKEDIIKKMEFKPLCTKDRDCVQEKKIGFCIAPNTSESRCEFEEDTKVQLTVINDKTCLLCSTDRMISVLKQLFPNLEIEEWDIATAKGISLASELGVKALPAYILNENISHAKNYPNFKQALIPNGEYLLISPQASGSPYYYKKAEIKNRLDLVVADKDASSAQAQKNLKEFLDAFQGKIEFIRHTENDTLFIKEFDITTFPAFIINNRIKFGGILPAELIKEKFCQYNPIEVCKKQLSMELLQVK